MSYSSRPDHSRHWYRTDLLSRSKTTYSPGWRAGTKRSGLKVPPLVPARRPETKWGHLVPVGNTNRDYRGRQAVTWRSPWPPLLVLVGINNRDYRVFFLFLFLFPFHFFIDFGFQLYMFSNLFVYTPLLSVYVAPIRERHYCTQIKYETTYIYIIRIIYICIYII